MPGMKVGGTRRLLIPLLPWPTVRRHHLVQYPGQRRFSL